jgi:hypothetical protein
MVILAFPWIQIKIELSEELPTLLVMHFIALDILMPLWHILELGELKP